METRVLNWVGAAVGLIVAAPVARAMFKEFQAYREMKAQSGAVIYNLYSGLPPEAVRDIYDSTRG